MFLSNFCLGLESLTHFLTSHFSNVVKPGFYLIVTIARIVAGCSDHLKWP